MRAAGIVLGAGLAMLVASAATNLALTSIEKSRYRAPGKLVLAGSKRMHVYSEGRGTRNAVLLSGWGTACPAIDYKPLIEALKSDFTVSVVEYPGYGWSDWTDEPRTNEKIVQETRLALREAEILPPYVLVAHSISGLYALYYANKYPEEIDAIVGLDSTVPAQRTSIPPGRPSRWPGIMRVSGILRLIYLFAPGAVGHESPAYSETDRRMIAMMYFWNYGNPSQWNELAELGENARELDGWKYPGTIPVRMILASASVDQGSKSAGGLDWKRAHEEIIAGNKDGRVYVLNGTHYVHATNAEAIAAIIRDTRRS